MASDHGLNEAADLRQPAVRAIAGIGRVVLWSGGSLWIGRAAGQVQFHSHHAIQMSLALSGRVHFRTAERDDWLGYSAALVMPHQRHQFDGGGESVAQLFIEPETTRGRALLARHAGRQIVALEGRPIEQAKTWLRDAYATRAKDDSLIATGERVVALLSGQDCVLQTDPRVTRAIDWMRSRLKSPLSLNEVASVAHLSPSRFRHLFMAQTGISFRAYVLWARVSSAVASGMGGASWTEAAQAWGFADSAHLSRTCRRMFGIAPSSLMKERQGPDGRPDPCGAVVSGRAASSTRTRPRRKSAARRRAE